MNRREFITLAGAAAAAPALLWPRAVCAQPQGMPVIGFLNGQAPAQLADRIPAFHRGLSEVGYTAGQNVSIEYRWAEGEYSRLPALAADLVQRHVAVIVGSANTSALAAKAATTTIPIVFTTNGDPVGLGLVKSLNRPSGNLTGIGLFSGPLVAKRLSLLRDMAPGARVIGVLLDPKNQAYASQRKETQEAARALGVKVVFLTAASEQEIDAAFAALAQQQIRALLVGASATFIWNQREQIVDLAARHAIPALYTLRDYPAAGGLMSYGPSPSDTYRRLGVYAGKILKGAAPPDLPIEHSSRFEYVINRNAGRALNLDIPPRVLALADEVIE
jgi:putative tryptophan/tyrosine transport system substrate-binding protein